MDRHRFAAPKNPFPIHNRFVELDQKLRIAAASSLPQEVCVWIAMIGLLPHVSITRKIGGRACSLRVAFVFFFVLFFLAVFLFVFFFVWLLSKENIGSYRPIRRV